MPQGQSHFPSRSWSVWVEEEVVLIGYVLISLESQGKLLRKSHLDFSFTGFSRIGPENSRVIILAVQVSSSPVHIKQENKNKKIKGQDRSILVKGRNFCMLLPLRVLSNCT